MDYKKIVDNQRAFFDTKETRNYAYRYQALKKLKEIIILYEKDIQKSLKEDLNKSEFESYLTEIGVVILEINETMKKLRKWMKPKKVKTPIHLFKAKSFIYNEPYGVVLIMSPWNYPFQLAISPLIGVIAAGNTAVIKTSPDAPHTSATIKKMIKEVFNAAYVEVLTGDVEESKNTLAQNYDYIFFTGGVEVAKIVMERASKDLIPITLELGGKSPAIIDDTISLDITAKRIVYGKFINAGQTCIAPDYIMIKEELKNELINKMKYYIHQFFGSDPLTHPDYPKIINQKNHQRLIDMIDQDHVVIGGKHNKEKIEPTILNNITKNSKVMKEEIFGPILPMCTYVDTKDLVEKIKQFSKPLALYVFTKNKKFEQDMIEELSFGGATINDTIMHFANSNLPFGGVGSSGIGNYHGYHSFETFSHQKGVVKRSTIVDISFRYPPYENKKIKFLKKIIK